MKLGKVESPVCHVVPELWRGPRRGGTRGAGGALRGAKRRAAVRASEAESLRARHARPQLLDRRGLVTSQVSSQLSARAMQLEVAGRAGLGVGARS